MSLVEIIWVCIPALVGLTKIAFSFRFLVLSSSKLNIGLSTLILLLNAFSIYILVSIYNGAWPTFIPHILITISTLLFVWQVFKQKR